MCFPTCWPNQAGPTTVCPKRPLSHTLVRSGKGTYGQALQDADNPFSKGEISYTVGHVGEADPTPGYPDPIGNRWQHSVKVDRGVKCVVESVKGGTSTSYEWQVAQVKHAATRQWQVAQSEHCTNI